MVIPLADEFEVNATDAPQKMPQQKKGRLKVRLEERWR